jgi:hypothetical protein
MVNIVLDLTNEDENEISDGAFDDLSVVDNDREEFFHLVNSFLWDADESADSSSKGRQYQFRRRGLMQRTMPTMVQRQDNLMGQTYRGVVDGCYDILCALGLRGLASSIARMFS